MAFYNMPLLWILAGRNDVLIWLTGWSYREFATAVANHSIQSLGLTGFRVDQCLPPLGSSRRYCSGYCALCVCISELRLSLKLTITSAYTWLELDYLPSMFAYEYWAMGVFATVVMCMMLPLAIRPFRERMYETFLMLHIMMALATLILLFYHVKIFDGEYDGWLWACVAIWVRKHCLRPMFCTLKLTHASSSTACSASSASSFCLTRPSARVVETLLRA